MITTTPKQTSLQEIAKEYAQRCGWELKNAGGMRRAHPDDITNAMLSFHNEASAMQPAKEEDGDAIHRAIQDVDSFLEKGNVAVSRDFMRHWHALSGDVVRIILRSNCTAEQQPQVAGEVVEQIKSAFDTGYEAGHKNWVRAQAWGFFARP